MIEMQLVVTHNLVAAREPPDLTSVKKRKKGY